MMNRLLFATILLFSYAISFAQNPSMTISHQGISPYDTLTVFAGDAIDFFHGGGGPHPMTEGWQTGESSTPIPFETQTVTSSNPSVTFVLDTPGTYYFHCGTNPGNSDNWGMITVLENNSTEIAEIEDMRYNIYPNPVTDVLRIEGLNGFAEIFTLEGKKVMDVNSSSTNVSALLKGMYIVKIEACNFILIKE